MEGSRWWAFPTARQASLELTFHGTALDDPCVVPLVPPAALGALQCSSSKGEEGFVLCERLALVVTRAPTPAHLPAAQPLAYSHALMDLSIRG
eukprot:7311977-Prymnesium_polylepis.2